MRFAVAALSCGLLLTGTVGVALACAATDEAGFTIGIPGDWTEQPAVEKATVGGFQKADPDDSDVAFAWSDSGNDIIVIVQAMTSTAQIKAGAYRANSEALVNSIAQSVGLSGAHSTVSDDGTVVTGNTDGDYTASNMHLVMMNQAMIDSTRHMRGYSAVCAMRQPITDSARSTCASLLSSFKVTLDPSTFLPLEAK